MSHSKRIKEDGNTGASEGNSNGSSASDNNANHHDLSGDGKIVIIDFGSQFTHIIARRIRELHVYCDLFSCLTTLENLLTSNSSNHMNGNNNNAKTEVPSKIVGVILSGGPASIYEEGAPRLSKDIWKYLDENKIPVLGICYGMCEMAVHYGGRVAASAKREYGLSRLKRAPENTSDDPLLGKILDHEDDVVWMSHGDKVEELPAGFQPIACTENGKFAAIMGPAGSNRFAFQFHPEVTHSVHGKEMLKNFVVGICNAPTNWNMKNIAEDFVENIRKIVGPHDHVIGAVSGGVDSSVAAVLLNKAIGDRFHAVLVDNGCLRLNEAKLVHERLTKVEKMDLIVVDAADRFMAKLKGVEDPEKKRKIIGNEFIEIFQEEANRLKKEKLPEGQSIKYLLQGTLYPDVIESLSYKGPSATIKTHHNVGGLPAKMDLKLIEPLRELFKDEVRELGIALGLDPESVWRHPFPGPGLAIRILGEVTKEKADKLRHADDIMIQEIRNAGIYNEISQAFVVLLPVKSVGVMGDHRTYEEVAAVRCVTTTDFMTADWYHMDPKLMSKISSRIINEVNGFNRVVYDISSKPPSTIEWE